MAHRSDQLSDQLRAAIRNSSLTVYRVAKDCGIAESQLHNFMYERCGLGVQKIDRLVQYLQLELRPKRRPANRKKKT